MKTFFTTFPPPLCALFTTIYVSGYIYVVGRNTPSILTPFISYYIMINNSGPYALYVLGK